MGISEGGEMHKFVTRAGRGSLAVATSCLGAELRVAGKCSEFTEALTLVSAPHSRWAARGSADGLTALGQEFSGAGLPRSQAGMP